MEPEALPLLDYAKVEKKIRGFLKKEAGGRGVVLGLSGGIDSATVAALAVKALGSSNVLALIMPEDNSTPREDHNDAMSFAKNLGIEHKIVNITRAADCVFSAVSCPKSRVADGNVKARLRMIMLYYYANAQGRIVAGSGDRSELLIGYFTKYGDGGADILPIGGLFKTQVRELAKALGVPRSIVKKKSSPRLWNGQTAEGELGMNYEQVDLILHLLMDRKMGRGEIAGILGEGGAELVDKVMRRIECNAHKLRMPPIPKI